eukprot:CAMPEP_0115526710 /NCGR_PEP_ID=MMETSP0271-20121206/82455_1 /TAXON_ID=71861 /ORGANISM="Scrippsiella trochoidea, Strain CCMP3099" /LENGTH=60 /DNA_ID=CAMNT_0002958487 /DNA_START=19 /DNA_END=197 /DNA_ORIENTATION=-
MPSTFAKASIASCGLNCRKLLNARLSTCSPTDLSSLRNCRSTNTSGLNSSSPSCSSGMSL